MFANATRGLYAGAVGTLVLNVVTYVDLTLRGRPTSTVPADTAGRVAEADVVPHAAYGAATVVAFERLGRGGR